MLPAIAPARHDAIAFRYLLLDDGLVFRHGLVLLRDVTAHVGKSVGPTLLGTTRRVRSAIRGGVPHEVGREELVKRGEIALR
ncbi:MAG TPA: hypothetical protein VGS80_17020, partial [Ktedonobacterales bacterium]|nr:hypothetical protein [Ktedonobacterales bacterium]